MTPDTITHFAVDLVAQIGNPSPEAPPAWNRRRWSPGP